MVLARYLKHHVGLREERWWCRYCSWNCRFYDKVKDSHTYADSASFYDSLTPEERTVHRTGIETRLMQGCPSEECPSHHQEKRVTVILAAIEMLQASQNDVKANAETQKHLETAAQLVQNALECEDPEDTSKMLDVALEELTADVVEKRLSQLGIEPEFR